MMASQLSRNARALSAQEAGFSGRRSQPPVTQSRLAVGSRRGPTVQQQRGARVVCSDAGGPATQNDAYTALQQDSGGVLMHTGDTEDAGASATDATSAHEPTVRCRAVPTAGTRACESLRQYRMVVSGGFMRRPGRREAQPGAQAWVSHLRLGRPNNEGCDPDS